MEVLTQGIIRYPSSSLLLRLLGEGYLLGNDVDSAHTALRQALQIDKDDAYANELMAKSLSALGQKQRAAHYLMQAKSLQRTSRN